MQPGRVMISRSVRRPGCSDPGAEKGLHRQRVRMSPAGFLMNLHITDSDVPVPASLRTCFRGVSPGLVSAPRDSTVRLPAVDGERRPVACAHSREEAFMPTPDRWRAGRWPGHIHRTRIAGQTRASTAGKGFSAARGRDIAWGRGG